MSEGFDTFEARTWLARVWTGGDSQKGIVGTAFAVDGRHLLTCAHVVEKADAKGPSERVYVDFPLLGERGSWATVLEDGWRPEPRGYYDQSAGDIAVLQLEDASLPVEPLPLRSRWSYKGLSFSSYGFPSASPESDVAHGQLGLRVGLEWVRVEADSIAIVEPGFSGAPVWADDLRGAVAMILTRKKKDGDGRVAYAVPLSVVAKASTIVAAALRGLSDPLAWLDRVPASLEADVISFRRLIEDHTTDFVGREFVFSALEQRLADREFPAGYVIIRGEPGIGKSALMAQLARTRGYAHHFNIAPDNVRAPKEFLPNVCAQLIVRYDLPYDELPPTAAENSQLLMQLLTEATERAAKRGDSPVVLLVDALDEAEQPPTDVNRLFLPKTLPDGAYIVATIRAGVDPYLNVDRRAPDIVLSENSRENEADVKAYITEFLKHHRDTMMVQLAAWGTDPSAFTEILWQHSEGNFMYLHHVLPDIHRGKITKDTFSRLDSLPKGLHDYYQRHWRRMKDQDRARFRRLQQPVLCVLAVAREAVSADAVAEWINESGRFTPVDVGEVEDVFNEWFEFLNEDEGDPPRFRLYHNSFLDFLEGEVGLKRYRQAVAAAMGRKVEWSSE